MKILTILIALSFLTFSSCSYMLYSPNPDIVEPVNEKGQIQTSATFGYSNTHKIGLGINYGLTDNIALSASASKGVRQKYASFAIGYFKNLNSNTFVDVYAGYTMGNGFTTKYFSNNTDSKTYKGNVNSTYNRYFIIGGIHKIIHKIQLDATISSGVMDFSKFVVFSEVIDLNYINSLSKITPVLTIQPGIRIAFLDEKGKLYVGLVLYPNNYSSYDLHQYNLYAGISTDLNLFLNKHKE